MRRLVARDSPVEVKWDKLRGSYKAPLLVFIWNGDRCLMNKQNKIYIAVHVRYTSEDMYRSPCSYVHLGVYFETSISRKRNGTLLLSDAAAPLCKLSENKPF